MIEVNLRRHFGSYKPGKLRGTKHKGRNSAVQSSQFSWAGQYKKCVQYDFQFTLEYSDMWTFSIDVLVNTDEQYICLNKQTV